VQVEEEDDPVDPNEVIEIPEDLAEVLSSANVIDG